MHLGEQQAIPASGHTTAKFQRKISPGSFFHPGFHILRFSPLLFSETALTFLFGLLVSILLRNGTKRMNIYYKEDPSCCFTQYQLVVKPWLPHAGKAESQRPHRAGRLSGPSLAVGKVWVVPGGLPEIYSTSES